MRKNDEKHYKIQKNEEKHDQIRKNEKKTHTNT